MTIIEALTSRTTPLTTTEMMALMRVTRHTLTGWARYGRVPAYLTPAGYLYDPAEVADWFKERSNRQKK
jgi:hypothetical protein